MEAGTAGWAIIVTILRLLHIVAGVIWVGAGITVSMYLEPALTKSGVDSGKVMRTLYTKTSFDKLMPIVSIITTVAGLILYYMVSNGFSDVNYMKSGQGIVLSIGALAGLAAFGHGFATLGKYSRRYAALIAEAGNNPSDEQLKSLNELEAKLTLHGKMSMWMGVVAVVFMAGARHIGPLFGS